MTLREFIVESCNGKCAAKDFEDEKDLEMDAEVKDEGGKFTFKVEVEAADEDEAKKMLKDAVKDFGKVTGIKKAKKEEPEDMDEEYLGEGNIGKMLTRPVVSVKLIKLMADYAREKGDLKAFYALEDAKSAEEIQEILDGILDSVKKYRINNAKNKKQVDKINKKIDAYKENIYSDKYKRFQEKRLKEKAALDDYKAKSLNAAKKFEKDVCPKCGKNPCACKF